MIHRSRRSPLQHLPRLLVAVFLSAAASGCGFDSCIDAMEKREPKPIEGTHAFEVLVPGLSVVRKEYLCEEYYDAMCAERGNYWAVREVSTLHHSTPSKLSIVVPDIGTVEFEVPRCDDLLGEKRVGPELFPLTIDGHPYFYIRSEGNMRVYQKVTLNDVPEVFVNLKFDVTIDGKSVDWQRAL